MIEAKEITPRGVKESARKNSEKPNTRKVPKKITESYLTNSGQFYLERFTASKAQFRRVMGRKIYKSCQAHPEQDREACNILLEKVIEKFERAGFLNDAGYAKGLARSLSARGWPKKRIAMRLREKGISGEQIENVWEDEEPQADLVQAVRMMKRKKLGAFADKAKEHDKQLAAMARAGFDYETASRALSVTRLEAEEILNSLS